VRSPRPNTLAFVTLNNGNAQYSFVDENTAGRMLETSDLPSLPTSIQAFHFGAISLIPEPCGATFESLMARHHQTSVMSLDPNIRPGFVTDETAYRDRLLRMIGMSDIVKVSEEDPAVLIVTVMVDILRFEGCGEGVFLVRRFGVGVLRCGWNGTGCPRRGRRGMR
jgi:fructokinase